MRSALLILVIVTGINVEGKNIVQFPNLSFEPCLGSFLVSTYQYGAYPVGGENQYYVAFNTELPAGTVVTVEFDSEANMTLPREIEDFALIRRLYQSNTYYINFHKNSSVMVFIVKGKLNGIVPYFNSVIINNVERCETPIVGYVDDLIKYLRIARQTTSSLASYNCGRRKTGLSGLIVNGQSTEPGEWPWHAAIYKHKGSSNSYICGGTLISKHFVLTAAQCATVKKAPVVPDILSVVLGKYHMTGGDESTEEREVFAVIIHEDYGSPLGLDNDIALLKLKTEAVYNKYVQPACLWSSDESKLPTEDIVGAVVGWGYNQINDSTFSAELKQASLPMIPEIKCIKKNPTFYGTLLRNDRKFCAGWGNGTSPCNGDSGGGFMVYVPDGSGTAGSWYVRGIVSTVIPYPRTRICDPLQYVVFTDTQKYVDWIERKTSQNVSRGR